MLNSYPRIVFPPEFHFIRRYIASNKEIDLGKLKKDKYLKRLSISKIIKKLKKQKNLNWVLVYKTILKEYLNRKEGDLIGDKDPKNIEYLPIIYKLFPQARILHIIRDPRDVFLSRQKAEWSKDKNWFSQIMAYRIQYKIGRRNGKKYFGNNYYELRYEDLIRKPKVTLKRICKKIKIDYKPQMLQFSKSAKEIMSKEEEEWKKETTGPLLSNNFQKWRDSLSRKKIVLIENLCQKVFEDGFYKKEYPLTLLEKIKLSLLNIIANILEYFYVMILNYKQRNLK